MSSDLFSFDNSVFFQPFSPFTQHLQEIRDDINVLIQENNTSQFHTSSLSHLGNTDCSVLEEFKTNECQLNFDCFSAYTHSFLPHTFDQVHETALSFRQQQCYSSNDQNFSFRRFSRVSETQNSDNHVLSSAEDSFSMKRICTTGDLQKGRTCVQMNNMSSTSPLSTDKSFMEESNFKVGPIQRRREKREDRPVQSKEDSEKLQQDN
ncbi:UNVERIFIED_CONTAM: hypothetical protein Sangu_2551200 [Sesamum angustifolium]|uniref:Uncharacterized protein n=1 Tax=Sesamum angustifolium TaxID=2727405 RepID=A0AAW2J9Q0_9LAMI